MASRKDAVRITGAAPSGEDDVRKRMRKYLITMGIRVLCLVLAFVVSGWWIWVCLVGAVLLPWVAVLIANAGRERSGAGPDVYVDSPAYPQLERRAQRPSEETVLEGEIAPEPEEERP